MKNYNITIGISSGIAAYKIVDLIKLLKEKKFDIEVILTKSAERMFGRKMFEEAVGHKVYCEFFADDFNYQKVLEKRKVTHIELAEKADIFVIAPATANIIGKIANGIADDLLTTTILAAKAQVVICPAMNSLMWKNPAVVENIENLRKRNYLILPPESGSLACGTTGIGRLVNTQIILRKIENILINKNRLKGKRIIVTAGATWEEIDAVRIITNRGSGKMGKAIAQSCQQQGAQVLLIRAENAVKPDFYIPEKIFNTGGQLLNLIKEYVPDYDYIFHTASVTDFLPEVTVDKKIDSSTELNLKLKISPKIIDRIKTWNPKIKLIGFKAVYKEKEEDLIKIGMEKLKKSRADYIVVNDVGKEGVGFAVDTNEVYLLSRKGLIAKIGKAKKEQVAEKLLDLIFT